MSGTIGGPHHLRSIPEHPPGRGGGLVLWRVRNTGAWGWRGASGPWGSPYSHSTLSASSGPGARSVPPPLSLTLFPPPLSLARRSDLTISFFFSSLRGVLLFLEQNFPSNVYISYFFYRRFDFIFHFSLPFSKMPLPKPQESAGNQEGIVKRIEYSAPYFISKQIVSQISEMVNQPTSKGGLCLQRERKRK